MILLAPEFRLQVVLGSTEEVEAEVKRHAPFGWKSVGERYCKTTISGTIQAQVLVNTCPAAEPKALP